MRILALTDLNSIGSGYSSLSLPILVELSRKGYEVKAIGLSNDGSQHSFPFSIFPSKNVKDALAMIQNLWSLWTFDVLLVLLDLSIQRSLMDKMGNRPFKYVGVFPIEADPLCYSWAMSIFQMDKPFIISKFGTEEAHKKFIEKAEYLPVGIDTQSWNPPTEEERLEVRKAFGIGEETYVVLTVADNQERKNLQACFFAFKQFSEDVPDSKYVLVTRSKLFAGWNLQELADTIGITDKLMILERGMPFRKLWMVYAMSDAFMLLSKTEGLGLPVLEAQAMRLPVVGTNCTGIRELISDGRGFPVNYEYMHIDPFANGHRYWADPEHAAQKLVLLHDHKGDSVEAGVLDKAQECVKGRTWEKAVDGLITYLESIKDEQKEKKNRISGSSGQPVEGAFVQSDDNHSGDESV